MRGNLDWEAATAGKARVLGVGASATRAFPLQEPPLGPIYPASISTEPVEWMSRTSHGKPSAGM
jgi:hypothetical protein